MAALVEQALDRLAAVGPALGRPLVDTLEHSRLRNLKELRPGSRGHSEIRILFVFDPDREAIILVASDKAGRWSHWYDDAIPLAEQRFADYRAQKHARKLAVPHRSVDGLVGLIQSSSPGGRVGSGWEMKGTSHSRRKRVEASYSR
ncbi:type II toxin-antitoxin system RelE/ParE family toxin [Nocardia brasiliensis]|uniref:type II toxin-antitoxin system RelE/ParE family toxin n=1 Tax=Nocardia brasiliensis TaxID=37326 RepID=UPI002458A7E9|nr:type II toxin-antitoxin system RelE/ParE family toxin [Nocardia brasiliensis]